MQPASVYLPYFERVVAWVMPTAVRVNNREASNAVWLGSIGSAFSAPLRTVEVRDGERAFG